MQTIDNQEKTNADRGEVIYVGEDTGWHRDLEVKLITYSDGRQDLHRQTGLQFKEHIAKATEILAGRGLKVGSVEFIGPTGAYLPVTKMEVTLPQPAAA